MVPVTAKVLTMLAETTASLGWVARALDKLPLYQIEIAAKLAEAERDEADHLHRRAEQAPYQRSLRGGWKTLGRRGVLTAWGGTRTIFFRLEDSRTDFSAQNGHMNQDFDDD